MINDTYEVSDIKLIKKFRSTMDEADYLLKTYPDTIKGDNTINYRQLTFHYLKDILGIGYIPMGDYAKLMRGLEHASTLGRMARKLREDRRQSGNIREQQFRRILPRMRKNG